MNEVIWQSLLQESKRIYYTDMLVVLCQLIALVISLRYINREKAWLFLIYSTSGILLSISDVVRYFFAEKISSAVIYTETINIVFAVIEYSIFFLYYKTILTNKLIIVLSLIIFLLISLASMATVVLTIQGYVSDDQIYKLADYLTSTELFTLATICISYFYDIFKRHTSDDLLSRPSFWITITIFLYSAFVIPFFSVSLNIMNTNTDIYYKIYTAHYLAFGILYIGIVKALLCKRPLTD